MNYYTQNRFVEALNYFRRATDIHRVRVGRVVATRSIEAREEQASVRHIFLRHVRTVAETIERDPQRHHLLAAEAFEVGQLAKATSAAAAVARMAARFAAVS